MFTDEIAFALSNLIDQNRAPSHDELARAIDRVGLGQGDPARQAGADYVGKVKRVRAVFSHALDHDPVAGEKLALILIQHLKVDGAFRAGEPSYVGTGPIQALRESLRPAGYALNEEGAISRLLIEDLDSPEATDVLRSYVNRARHGEADAALVVGTGKDLVEATARHVLVRKTGAYPAGDNFPATLYQTFDRLGMRQGHELAASLDADPRKALDQALYLLAVATSRVRNAEATGHGRPEPTALTAQDGRTVIEAMALVSATLLRALERP